VQVALTPKFAPGGGPGAAGEPAAVRAAKEPAVAAAKAPRRPRKPTKPFSPAAAAARPPKGHTSPAAAAAAGKCCTQCGATKTPQWREGPLGPKTLCNACGVKRVRAARAAAEGRTRGAPRPAKKSKRASAAAPKAGKRAAAHAAALILAAVQEREALDSDDGGHGTPGGRRGSEEREEMTTWNPPAGPAAPGPVAAAVGEGAAAALGLVTMSVSQDLVEASHREQVRFAGLVEAPSVSRPFAAHPAFGAGALPPGGLLALPAPFLGPHLAQLHAAAAAPPAAAAGGGVEALQEAAGAAARNAAIAEAAVAAVAQVLALKQAVALHARAEAQLAAQRFLEAQALEARAPTPPPADASGAPDPPAKRARLA